jgi:kynureninase
MKIYENKLSFAKSLDAADPIQKFQKEFHYPKHLGKKAIYFCGNSLGLQPKIVEKAIKKELDIWRQKGVEGWFAGDEPWLSYHSELAELTAPIVGAQPAEVIVMNTLTVNLHLLMVSFYRPTATRFKILMEGGAFPSDQYAIESQVKFHGFDPNEAIIELQPRNGEDCLRTEAILQQIENHKDTIALILISGINYYTGQRYDMPAITAKGQSMGAKVGFDLAHAAGNVPLQLHDWGVDFAVWCGYKYLNSGPGGVSGAFIHEKHFESNLPRFAGWWGHDESLRFKMEKGFIPMHGAAGWQVSTVQVVPLAMHKVSLEIFKKAGGMAVLSEKSRQLTDYLRFLLEKSPLSFQIITPTDYDERGAQLSLLMDGQGKKCFDALTAKGIIGDWREPNVIRLAPAPLYNSFEEVWRVGNAFFEIA